LNYYHQPLVKPGRHLWITGIVIGASVGAGLGAAAYTTKRAIDGQMPWDDPLEGFTGALKASAIGGATGAVGGGVGGALGGLTGGAAGAAGGGGAGGGTGGGVAAGSVAAESGAAAGIPTVVTPAVAEAATGTTAELAGGALSNAGTAAEALGGGAIVDSAGSTIGSALAPETTAAVVPAAAGPSLGQQAAGFGAKAVLNAGINAGKDALTGDGRGFGRSFATNLASGVVSQGLGTIGRGLTSDFTPRPDALPNPDAVAQKSLLDVGRGALLSSGKKLLEGAIPKAGGSMAGGLVAQALGPKPPAPPDPFSPIQPFGGMRRAMGGGLGMFGGVAGGSKYGAQTW